MKKSLYILVAASAAAILLASCAKEVESVPTEDNNGPVYITANIDPETKATLAEGNGAFAFSSGDVIKVCNESGAFSGTTTSTTDEGTFVMEDGFIGSTNGIAGFPASIVSDMTVGSVTFILPASYEYAAVGGADPDAAKVPSPMIGSYNGTTKRVSLKQAGSVVRFRVTNIKAGSLSFTFPQMVTGQVTLSAVPSGTSDGILATGLSTAGNTITVSNVPAVADGSYIYITLPVPTATVPNEILVTNTPSDPSLDIRMQSLKKSDPIPAALNRAGGWKWGVSPSEIPTPTFTINASGDKVILAPGNLMAKIDEYSDNKATATDWKFGGYLETVGNAVDAGNYLLATGSEDCVGKWVDLFTWQGESVAAGYRAHGLVNWDADNNGGYDTWYGRERLEEVYSGCWDGLSIANGGGYNWRPLSKDEWEYILSYRKTSKLGSVSNARNARVTVAGINGLLLFPDNIGSVWNTTTMGSYPSDINNDDETAGRMVAYTWGTDEYTADQMVEMANVGIVFLPCTGYRSGAVIPINTTFREFGYYWSKSGSITRNKTIYAEYLRFASRDVNVTDCWKRQIGRAVRLARDVKEPESVGRGSHFTWDE